MGCRGYMKQVRRTAVLFPLAISIFLVSHPSFVCFIVNSFDGCTKYILIIVTLRRFSFWCSSLPLTVRFLAHK